MRAAVLGRPVAHSLSPLLHRAAYAALGLDDWTYDALDVGAGDLPVLLAGLGPEWRGFSVTMPCKQAAVDVADLVEPLPRLLHAANTLIRTDAGWRAENTDVSGIGMALQLAGVEQVGAAAIIGAGGTAAAAAVALASLGAQQVEVVVRDPARAGGVTRVLDADRRRPRGDGGGEHGADGGPAGCRGAALAVRSDRARRPLRELAHPGGAARDRRGRDRRRRSGRALLAGDPAGGADDGAAGPDRCDAGRPRRRRGSALTRWTRAGSRLRC
jgi:Shikimate dehydrogenase substrate binding domain